jgi:hypothetical protein
VDHVELNDSGGVYSPVGCLGSACVGHCSHKNGDLSERFDVIKVGEVLDLGSILSSFGHCWLSHWFGWVEILMTLAFSLV